MKDFNREAMIKGGRWLGILGGVVLLFALALAVFQWAWNQSVAPVLGLPVIGYWQGLGLIFVAKSVAVFVQLGGKIKVDRSLIKLVQLEIALEQLKTQGVKAFADAAASIKTAARGPRA